MLRLVLPKGSLEQATLQLFEDADLAVVRSSDVDYRAAIDDPRVAEVRILRPQEIPRYIADGLFDLGRHRPRLDRGDRRRGRRRSRSSTTRRRPRARPASCVAVAADSPWASVKDLPDGRAGAHRVSRAHAPLPREARRPGRHHAVVRRDGGEDPGDRRRGRRPHRVGTGAACRPGCEVIDTILVSYTELIANPTAYADADKRKAMEQLQTLLSGALEARGRVLVKLNVDGANCRRSSTSSRRSSRRRSRSCTAKTGTRSRRSSPRARSTC